MVADSGVAALHPATATNGKTTPFSRQTIDF
jgi:hypothetical protein